MLLIICCLKLISAACQQCLCRVTIARINASQLGISIHFKMIVDEKYKQMVMVWSICSCGKGEMGHMGGVLMTFFVKKKNLF